MARVRAACGERVGKRAWGSVRGARAERVHKEWQKLELTLTLTLTLTLSITLNPNPNPNQAAGAPAAAHRLSLELHETARAGCLLP